ncbi:BRCT domain-containing protein At4g02110-like [Lycium barbarum]|uniref:BRCT domain-containing protein At4g02110-like n=1 Tax=Lycium barbarum TaxID=112863 RepID=UPI00293F6246|nr:BRCT domain-containing protein At4g02110-like [Lycium barbarum]
MNEGNQDMLYEDPSKMFTSVLFVLVGFEPLRKGQIRAKLVEGGGVDGNRYGPDCTHLIVDGITYDDPVCVAARRDGKIVVTSLWVEHSFDVGMPVDHHSVMYRPPRDLNGIPGAKSLIVCLTGYQRQDRDDIMTMVRLMGANFSKPLVATKVTHLICYKFEGEKYELAKKMKTIKLVNHRWLEDCLRSWEILSEADYDKSGYELEMMEAEAKDSEDENEDIAANKSGENIAIMGPEHPRSPSQFLVKQEASTNISDLSTFRGLSGLGNTKELSLSASKQLKSDQVRAFEESPKRHAEMLNTNFCRTNEELPTSMQHNGSDLVFVSNSARKSPHSCSSRKSPRRFSSPMTSEQVRAFEESPKRHAEMLNTNFYRTNEELPTSMQQNGSDMVFVSNGAQKSPNSCSSRKSPRKFISPMTSEQIKSNAGSPAATETGIEFDCFNLSSQRGQEKSELGVKTPRNLPFSGKGQSSRLPEKRKSISDSSFRSPRTGNNPESIPDGYLTANRTEELINTSKLHSLHEFDSHLSSGNTVTHFDKGATLDTVQHHDSTISNPVTLSTRRGHDKDAPQSGTCRIMGSKDTSHATVDVNGPLDEQHNVPSPGKERRDNLKSSVLAEFDKAGDDSMSASKPLNKRSLSKKTLGSRPSLGKGDGKNQKGSLFIDKTVLTNDSAASSSGGIEETEDQNILSSTKVEGLPADNADSSKEIEKYKFLDSEKEAAKTNESLNDDTEAPEDQEDEELNALREKSTGTEAQHSGLRSTEKKLNVNKVVNKNDKKDIAKRQSTENNKSETQKTFSGKETKLSESTSVGKASEEKVSKGPKYVKKNSNKTNLATKRAADSVEGAERKKCRTDRNKVEGKKGKGSPCEPGKATEHQFKSSMDVEKENIPVSGGQNASHNEHEADRTSPCGKKPRSLQITKVRSEPRWFIVSGHRLQRKEFQQVIKRLKGKVCRDSHQWSYQATHFIVPAPVRRTEKFFAAASSGRWILKTDYLTACVEAGKLLDEEPYEWHKKGLTEDLAISLEAPRKWRLLRERTGHGALYGMRIIIYGDCIVPPLDTLKRAVKAGDGIILATSPPYSRFLESGVDFAIVSEVMPRCDKWVQEFLRHEIPCVLPDYLVTYVCKPGFTLNNYVQYNTHAWAEKSLKKHVSRLEEIVEEEMVSSDDNSNDIACQVCGSPDREEVMLICGDESGSRGCGIGMHVDCCDPPLECVPEEDWFCPECSKNKSNTSTKRKSRKGTSTSKKKK